MGGVSVPSTPSLVCATLSGPLFVESTLPSLPWISMPWLREQPERLHLHEFLGRSEGVIADLNPGPWKMHSLSSLAPFQLGSRAACLVLHLLIVDVAAKYCFCQYALTPLVRHFPHTLVLFPTLHVQSVER
ncbi:hypothetical protein K491DRAFT_376641 [Lophiostoma macrostomum CBS 122681]|uniref:Uncharacterized protein n=1 Tax=Lophiostoma macrostomum CBS 122681 TaxID=1314788 RepID=A0A6A6T9B7_9PLEO|nr:hypothetical protein K491DRAFT_376641 [Lophiostoma macrostomum CBS 122681]